MEGGGLSPPPLRAESLAESLAERIAMRDRRHPAMTKREHSEHRNFFMFVVS